MRETEEVTQERDPLDDQINLGVSAEMQRLEKRPATADGLKQVLFGTVVPLFQDLLRQVNRRAVDASWAVAAQEEVVVRLQHDVDELMSDAMRVMPSDLPALETLARSTRDLVDALLDGKVPDTSDPAVHESLLATRAAADYVVGLIEDFESEPDEEGGDEDEGDDGSAEAEAGAEA